MKLHKIFWFLTITVFIGLLLPVLVQNGMFLDGVTYSGISKNMASGLGSFWNPQYTKILYTDFHEHPALFFIIQSFFFKVLGDGIYTERIFTFLAAIITATGMVLCWNLFNRNSSAKKHSWFIILLWITLPVIIWSYKNNMLENVLSIFTIFAVFFISKSLIDQKIIYLLCGSILIILAFLTKGPVGVFPLAVPLIYLLAFNKKRYLKTTGYWLLLILMTVSIFFVMMQLFPEMKQNITAYINQQVLPSLDNKREKYVESHFSIILKLLTELALPLLFVIFMVVSRWIKQKKVQITLNRESLYFLLIALSASLPMMITLKQRRYYLVPSLALYIIAVGFVLMPFIIHYLENLSAKKLTWIKRVTFVAFCGIIVFSVLRIGHYSRDEEKLKDIYVITESIPAGTIVSSTKNTWIDYALVAYLNRIGNISLDCDNENEYFLIEKESESLVVKRLLESYQIMDLDLKKYIVLKRIP